LIDRTVDAVRNSPERIVVVAAPPGYGKMDFVRKVAAADSARCVEIDLADCRTTDEVARRIVSSIVLDGTREATMQPSIIAFTSLQGLMKTNAASVTSLARWITRLSRAARVFILARRKPSALLDALVPNPVFLVGAGDLAVDLEQLRDRMTTMTDAWIDRYVAAFGGWPRAWDRLRAAALRPRRRLQSSEVRELSAIVRSEIEALDKSDLPAAITLAAFGHATAGEIALHAGLPCEDDVERSLGAVEGFARREDSGEWRMLGFARQVFFELREPTHVEFATRVILGVAETDMVRAFVMALESREAPLISALLKKVEPRVRMDVILRAEDRLGAAPFMISDDIFIQWWEAPRSRQRFSEIVEDLKSLRTFPNSDIRWRRNLASLLAQTETTHLTRVIPRLESFLSLDKIDESLRPLAYARLALGFAWMGDAENFGRLAPSLDPALSDTRRARLRYEYVRCVGDAVARRAVLGAMAREAAGVSYREREVAISTALDALFSADPSRLDLALARLHYLNPTDAGLDSALSYVEGGEAPLAPSVKHDPHLAAFATLLRAVREPEIGERALLLRAAMANADLSSDVELRIAARLAHVYAFPDDGSTLVADAEHLARMAGSAGLQGAVACAGRGEIDGPLLGLARRFGSEGAPKVRFRIGILDGVVRGPDNVPITLGERLFELAAFLGLHADGWADRDAIVEAIWPDHSRQTGVGALKTAAHRARNALGDPSAIVPKGNGYRLSPAVQSDVAWLESLLSAPPAMTVEALGGLDASYAVFAAGIERLRDGAIRWPWFERYSARVEGLLRQLAVVIAAVALFESKIEFAHRVAADLRSLDDADETAFKIALDAYRATGSVVAEAREIERYSLLLRSFGADPTVEITRLRTNPEA